MVRYTFPCLDLFPHASTRLDLAVYTKLDDGGSFTSPYKWWIHC